MTGIYHNPQTLAGLVHVELGRLTRLDEQVANVVKRIDSIEFANRAVSIGLLLAVLGGLAKLLGFAGTP
jgi:hypothetical protein